MVINWIIMQLTFALSWWYIYARGICFWFSSRWSVNIGRRRRHRCGYDVTSLSTGFKNLIFAIIFSKNLRDLFQKYFLVWILHDLLAIVGGTMNDVLIEIMKIFWQNLIVWEELGQVPDKLVVFWMRIMQLQRHYVHRAGQVRQVCWSRAVGPTIPTRAGTSSASHHFAVIREWFSTDACGHCVSANFCAVGCALTADERLRNPFGGGR